MIYRFTLILVLVTLVASDEVWQPITDKTTLEQFYSTCIQNVTLRSEEELKTQPPSEKDMEEVILCTVKKIGIFSEDSGYNVDRMVAQAHQLTFQGEHFREVFTNCADKNEERSPPAEWATRGLKCLVLKALDAFFEGIKKSLQQIPKS